MEWSSVVTTILSWIDSLTSWSPTHLELGHCAKLCTGARQTGGRTPHVCGLWSLSWGKKLCPHEITFAFHRTSLWWWIWCFFRTTFTLFGKGYNHIKVSLNDLKFPGSGNCSINLTSETTLTVFTRFSCVSVETDTTFHPTLESIPVSQNMTQNTLLEGHTTSVTTNTEIGAPESDSELPSNKFVCQ